MINQTIICYRKSSREREELKMHSWLTVMKRKMKKKSKKKKNQFKKRNQLRKQRKRKSPSSNVSLLEFIDIFRKAKAIIKEGTEEKGNGRTRGPSR